MLAAWQATIVSASGDIQPEAQITVTDESSGGLATLYSDRDGESAIANPFNADTEGFVRFYAPGGAYRITATLGLFTRTWRHVPIGTLGELDSLIGSRIHYERTVAELAAGVTPTNYAYPPGNILRYGADPSGVAASDTAVDSCQDAGYQVYAPRGTYLFNSTIAVKAAGFLGDGPNQTYLRFAGVDAFTLASDEGLSRPACIIEGFSVDGSTSSNCDGKFFFYAGGVASGATAVYNSGINICNVEVGRTNRFGGGFYVKDIFRMSVRDVGFTSVTRMIQIVGSVVQCSFTNVRSNNDDPGSTLTAYGISTETATYASSEVRTPENITFENCAYIRGDRGISHTAGLNVRFIDFDTEATEVAASLGNACRLHGGILAPSPTAADWIGVEVGVNPVGAEDLIEVYGVEINTLNVPSLPASSYGIDMGDGVSPVRNVHIHDVVVQGQANSLADAIRGRICNRLRVENCAVESGICSGTEINIDSSERVQIKWNALPDGAISVSDGGSATAYGEITHNECDSATLSLTTVTNWNLGPNEAIATIQSAHLADTFTGTLTGCTTSPTGTLRYIKNGRFATLFIPSITGTSNATTCTITGLPAQITPNRDQDCIGKATDNGANGPCNYRVKTTGVIEMYFGTSFAAFTGSGTKGTNQSTISWSLD